MKITFSSPLNYYSRGLYAFGNLRKSQAFGQGSWIILGMFASQLLRLAGNLVLTRLLVPEAFGLMSLVIAVASGINMLCDVGIRGGVIKSERSNDPAFMRTVWTLQLVRSALIAAALILVAVPAANFYDEPMLKLILPFWALNVMILGGKSVALYLYDKQLILKKQVFLDVGSQAVALVFMVGWAIISPSVWALVAGTLVGSLIALVASYTFFSGHYSKLAWDTDAVKELFGFGRWILLSTALGYLANQGDKLIMGAWLSMQELGVYAIASVMAAVITMVIGTLSSRLLQPLYRRHIDADSVAEIYKLRQVLNYAFVSGCVLLSWLGHYIIAVLYDDRYLAAGWMLQLLAVRGIGLSLNSTLTAYLLATGNSFSQLRYQIFNTTVLIAGMLVGSQWGVFGIIAAYSFAPVICHPYMTLLAKSHGFATVRSDVTAILIACSVMLAGWLAFDSPVLAEAARLLGE